MSADESVCTARTEENQCKTDQHRGRMTDLAKARRTGTSMYVYLYVCGMYMDIMFECADVCVYVCACAEENQHKAYIRSVGIE